MSHCDTCGAPLEAYDVFDPDTGEVTGKEIVCPLEWRHG